MNVKTYDLENTGRGYEPRYEMVESTGRGDEPDGLGDWVRKEDYDTAEFFHNRYRVESEKSHERKDIQIDALQAELATVKAERDGIQSRLNARLLLGEEIYQAQAGRIAQLEAALQRISAPNRNDFVLHGPAMLMQIARSALATKSQQSAATPSTWWDCICGASNSLDTCGHCHRSRLD